MTRLLQHMLGLKIGDLCGKYTIGSQIHMLELKIGDLCGKYTIGSQIHKTPGDLLEMYHIEGDSNLILHLNEPENKVYVYSMVSQKVVYKEYARVPKWVDFLKERDGISIKYAFQIKTLEDVVRILEEQIQERRKEFEKTMLELKTRVFSSE
jgi:hypothetical protein